MNNKIKLSFFSKIKLKFMPEPKVKIVLFNVNCSVQLSSILIWSVLFLLEIRLVY